MPTVRSKLPFWIFVWNKPESGVSACLEGMDWAPLPLCPEGPSVTGFCLTTLCVLLDQALVGI